MDQNQVEVLLRGTRVDEVETERNQPVDEEGIALFDLANQDRFIRDRIPAPEIGSVRFPRLRANALFNASRKNINMTNYGELRAICQSRLP